MRILLFILLFCVLSSCSLIKTKTDRCFDLFEEYGKANMHVYEKDKRVFSCTDMYPEQL